MPVYVTRAHVTIGDANKKPKNRSLVPKRSFHIGDIFQTPYCVRSFLASFLGLVIVTGGVLMTIIGYKPAILLPKYRTINFTYHNNVTDPTSVPNVLGEPGPLRILVYIGPICMGVGFFGMMMSIVLFCEIKDRYLNNIKPKLKVGEDHKDKMYDKIIEEFRKNYFRGIEVPLKKIERRKSKGRFSFSLSQSGSLMSFGRRLSQDLQRRFRRASKDSQPDRASDNKFKRSALRRMIDPDSWMKTSSLPNIRQKDSSFVELRDIFERDQTPSFASKRICRSCEPNLNMLKAPVDANGVDNPAFKESPQDKRRKVSIVEQMSSENSESNKYVTTVLVHRESNNDESNGRNSKTRRGDICIDMPDSATVYSGSDCAMDISGSNYSVVDLNRDVHILFKPIDDTSSIPDNERCESRDERCESRVSTLDTEVQKICKCDLDEFCQIHSECLDSDESSLTLSWDNIPSEWSDARRNTEPVVSFPTSFNTDDMILNKELNEPQRKSSVTSSQIRHKEIIKSRSVGYYDDSKQYTEDRDQPQNKSRGPFVRRIGVFKSDSNLLNVGPYSLLRQYHEDSTSNDSMDLTDEMLKNFEMVEEAYI